MRQVGFVAAALVLLAGGFLACGPDPNAKLPGQAAPPSGGTSSGGSAGEGGAVGSGGGVGSGGSGSGGVTAAGGGAGSSPFGDGGSAGATSKDAAAGGSTGTGGGGGTSPSGGRDGGGAGRDGRDGGQGGTGGGIITGRTGGRTGTGSGGSTFVSVQGGASGGGGSTTPGSGPLSVYQFGEGDEPCTPTKDLSGGQTGNLGTSAVCIRTADDLTSVQCNALGSRTLKVNGEEVACTGTVSAPAKLGSFYYFEVSAGDPEWASLNWFCSVAACYRHPVPDCGSYPTWVSGGSAPPCADAP